MADRTSDDTQEDVKQENEPAEGDTSGEDQTSQPTELDSLKETLKETQSQLKRYKEQESGHQDGVRKLQERIQTLESQISQKGEKDESLSGLSQEDLQYHNYLTDKMKVVTEDKLKKILQEQIAPFQAEQGARSKAEQKKIINEFIARHSDLQEKNDPEGKKMSQVISRVKRFAPADRSNPNADLDEHLEDAYYLAFREETNQEALHKAKAEGRAEGNEASDTQVGEGASTSSTSSKKQRTPEQEEVLRDWGVDDESIEKQSKKE